MAVNKELRADLLTLLGVGSRRLNQLAAARAAELPSSHEEAIHTIAYESGLKLSKYLSKDETAQVRTLVSQLHSRGQTAPAPTTTNGGSRGKRNPLKPVVVTIAGVNVEKLPGLSATHAKDAKMMAEKVYPTIYVFENSVRDLIERVLEAQFGTEWWTKAVPGKVQTTAKDHKAAEEKDPWHSRRGDRDIDYVFLTDLWAIIKHQWKHFKIFFPSQPWAETLITSDMNVSRRVLAHMTPLASDDVKNIEAAFRKWAKQLKASESLIP